MYPASFEYHRATSVADALALMQQFGDDAKVLAGGHSLLPLMKLRFVTPGHLIDIGRVAGLSGITQSNGQVVIGAMTRHAEVAASGEVAASLSALSDAARGIGDVQVRNCGTVGGSMAHADPGADMPAVMLASGAQIVATGSSGERVIDARNYFTGTFSTSLNPGELVTQVRIPVPPAGTGSAYAKHPDPASGYAVVGVAAVVKVSGGTIESASVALTGLAPVVTRLAGVEAALVGQPATVAAAGKAAQRAGSDLELYDDARGTAAYKANLAAAYAARALVAALQRASS